MDKLRSLSHRLSRSGDKRPRTESTISNARCASFGHHNASLTPQVPCASPRSRPPTINALPVDTQGIIITARSGAATEAPPAYTLTGPPPAYSTTRTAAAAAAAGAGAEAPPPEQQHACEYTMENMTRDDDPHYFLYLFDTVFLVDDSTSMLGPRWREVRSALRQITPVCTSHDDDGIDIHFMNHRSSENTTTNNNNNNSDDGISSLSGGGMARGKARGGYYNITDPLAVDALFQRLRPCGPTHTRGRIEDILEPYFTQLESTENVQDVRPLNLIVITDGMPGPCPRHVNFSGSSGFGSGFNGSGEAAAAHNPHLPDPAIVRYARRLDELRAPAWQVGVQFFQVGDDAAATASLRGLDDGLARRHGVRDIVDTLKFGDDDYKTLTAEEILKAVLGAVSRRLDNQSCEREGGRTVRASSLSALASLMVICSASIWYMREEG